VRLSVGGTWLALLDREGLGQDPTHPVEWQRVHASTLHAERMAGDWVHGPVFYIDCWLNDLEVTARALNGRELSDAMDRKVALRGHQRIMRKGKAIKRTVPYQGKITRWRGGAMLAHYAYRGRRLTAIRDAAPFYPLACLCPKKVVEEGWLYPFRLGNGYEEYVLYRFIPLSQGQPEEAWNLSTRPLRQPAEWVR